MSHVLLGTVANANTVNDLDASKSRFNDIRSDIATWIAKGGSSNLKLNSIDQAEYVSKMTAILKDKKVNINILEKDDATNEELKVSIDGSPKTCRGFISALDSRPNIICNLDRFKNTDEASQYSLVHHEFAGLVGVERNDGAASDYSVSSQITSYLSRQKVLKLAVKKGEALEKGDPVVTMTKNRYLGNDVFEVTLEVKNTKNVLQVALDKGEFETHPSEDCRSQASRVEFKNGNFIQNIQLSGKKCNTSQRFFKFDKVVVQYTDGDIKNFEEFKGHHGFDGYGVATKIKSNIEILKEETGSLEYKSATLITKRQDVKVQFVVKAEDMEEYNGVIFSDGTEYFTKDSTKLADMINSKELLLDLSITQDHEWKQKCLFEKSNYPLCTKLKAVPTNEFLFDESKKLPYVMLIKNTRKANVDVFRVKRIGNVETTYDYQK